MMSASKWTLFMCLITCFLRCSASEGDVTAKPGDNVNLECQGPKDANITLVKWDKHGLGKYDVFVFKDKKIHENLQHPSFHGRVELRDPEMKDGDVSVILKYVNINDTGTYECRVAYKGNKPQLNNTINLKVVTSGGDEHGGDEDGGDKDGGNQDKRNKAEGDEGNKDVKGGENVGLKVGLSVFGVLLVAGIIGVVIYRKLKKTQRGGSYEAPEHQLV